MISTQCSKQQKALVTAMRHPKKKKKEKRREGLKINAQCFCKVAILVYNRVVNGQELGPVRKCPFYLHLRHE